MKFRLKYIVVLFALFCCLFTVKNEAQVAIIANKNISVNKIDLNSLVNLYTLQSNELNGQKVKLFFYASENEDLKKFLSAIGKSSADLKKMWLKAKLTGNGNPPDNASGDEDMVQKVASTSNAVGFVAVKNANSSVKILMKLE